MAAEDGNNILETSTIYRETSAAQILVHKSARLVLSYMHSMSIPTSLKSSAMKNVEMIEQGAFIRGMPFLETSCHVERQN